MKQLVEEDLTLFTSLTQTVRDNEWKDCVVRLNSANDFYNSNRIRRKDCPTFIFQVYQEILLQAYFTEAHILKVGLTNFKTHNLPFSLSSFIFRKVFIYYVSKLTKKLCYNRL